LVLPVAGSLGEPAALRATDSAAPAEGSVASSVALRVFFQVLVAFEVDAEKVG